MTAHASAVSGVDAGSISARLAHPTEATVLLPAPGAPPRDLRVALWHPPPTRSTGAAKREGQARASGTSQRTGQTAATAATALRKAALHRGDPVESITMVLPAGNGVRRRGVPAHVVPLGALLDDLVALPADVEVTESVAALNHAVAFALELTARGRLLPSITRNGTDAWRAGPLDPADHRWLQELADAVPATLHASAVAGSKPLRITSARAALEAICDATADVLVRTAAAPVWGRAFAADEHVNVQEVETWLRGTASGAEHELTVALRLEPPGSADLEDGLGGCLAVVQVHSLVDPSLVIDAAELWDAPEVVLARLGTDAETTLLLALRRGARVWTPLRRLLDDPAPAEIELDDREATELLGPITEDLAAAGITVLWPRDLLRPLTLAAKVASTEQPEAVTGAMFAFEDLAELRFTLSLDGDVLTDEELDALANAKRTVVRLRGQWVHADAALLERARERRSITSGTALGLAMGETMDVDGVAVDVDVHGPLAHLAERLHTATAGPRALVPPSLDATLRPYQERGVAWLAEMAELGLGGVLADDMGLGKTIQLLAVHLARRDGAREAGTAPAPTLVICPVTLIANWEREAARFAPDVPVRRFHGTERSLEDVSPDELVLTTYGVVRRDAESLAEVAWGLVVADEAQAVKNPLARTARRLRTIDAQARFALTGTPVENRLSELWALLDWTTPGLLGPLERFRHEVAVPVERHRDPEATEALARLVRPFVLRRRKIDPEVISDLPPKTETDRTVLLTTEQATLYRALSTEILERIEQQEEGIARRGLIFKLLAGLKQICDHPALYLEQQAPLQGRSGKFEATLELLELVAQEGDAALLFTQYVQMGKLLEVGLQELGLRVAFLHGRVSLRRRQEMVDAFQGGELDVLLLSLKAGGTGLNLTAATQVVHYDRWWNPAVEDQASDRAWRIGQDRPVQVHRMVCEGTLEERIAEMLVAKRELAEAVVGAGEGWITELDDAALRELVSLSGDGATSGGSSAASRSPRATKGKRS